MVDMKAPQTDLDAARRIALITDVEALALQDEITAAKWKVYGIGSGVGIGWTTFYFWKSFWLNKKK